MDITTWSTPKSDWLYSLQPAVEKLYIVSKHRPGADCGSDHELLIAKFSLKLKKVEITTRPFSSIQFSHSLMSNSLQPHELQHARPPWPSPTPGVYSNLHLSSQCCHPAMLSSVVPFSSCSQSLPASESFPMSQLFAWVGQSTGVSPLASVLPKNTQDWSPLEWTGWISLQSKGLSRVFSNPTVQKHQFFGAQPSSQSNSHIHTWLLEKPQLWLYVQTFVGKVMSLLFNMLSRLVIAFLPSSKCLLISWLKLPSAVILEPKKIKSVTVSIVSSSICHEVMGQGDPTSPF